MRRDTRLHCRLRELGRGGERSSRPRRRPSRGPMTNADRHDLITPAKLRAWKACWTDERIAAYFADRAEIPARQITRDNNISISARMWVLTNALARKGKLMPYA